MRISKTAKPVFLHQLNQVGRLLPGLLVGSLVLLGCSEAQETSEKNNPPYEGSEEAVGSENEPTQAKGPSGEGLIDVDGGYTQEEQLAELEIVVEIMQEHFGDDVATIDGEPWTAERHEAEIAAQPQSGGVYRQEIEFDISPKDLEETYATAEKIAETLGFTENLNNSNGIGPQGRIFYGAGREEGRVFVISGESAELSGAAYQTRRSDHETIISAYESVVEKNRQERREQHSSDTPIEPEDLEVNDGNDAASSN